MGTSGQGTRSAAQRLVFIGGVDVSSACLEALCSGGILPSLVIGYDQTRASATGYADLEPVTSRYGIDLVRIRDANEPGLVQRIADLEPALIYVIGWSHLIRSPLLDLPEHGCAGIHPTLLPQGRGRAPIPWSILKGLRRTASTMFFLTEGVDDGEIVGSVEFELDSREDAGTLYAKHRAAHVTLVKRHTAELLAGDFSAVPQDHSRATYWPKRTPEDGRIDWRASAEDNDRLIRAVTRPFPGAFGQTSEGRIVVWRAEPRPHFGGGPGTVLRQGADVRVGCGQGSLALIEWEMSH